MMFCVAAHRNPLWSVATGDRPECVVKCSHVGWARTCIVTLVRRAEDTFGISVKFRSWWG